MIFYKLYIWYTFFLFLAAQRNYNYVSNSSMIISGQGNRRNYYRWVSKMMQRYLIILLLFIIFIMSSISNFSILKYIRGISIKTSNIVVRRYHTTFTPSAVWFKSTLMQACPPAAHIEDSSFSIPLHVKKAELSYFNRMG